MKPRSQALGLPEGNMTVQTPTMWGPIEYSLVDKGYKGNSQFFGGNIQSSYSMIRLYYNVGPPVMLVCL